MRIALGFVIGVVVGPAVRRAVVLTIPAEIQASFLEKTRDILNRMADHTDEMKRKTGEHND
jgi:hypothetical protein